MKHSILCVDDEVDNVDALERLLRKKYKVLKATGGPEALKILDEERVSLIISDQRMPKMTGVQFFEKSMKTHPEAVRILLTGYTDIESIVDAINSGQIYKYITKPWDPRDLTITVDKGIERYELTAELKEKNAALAEALTELKTLDEAKNQFMILINHELKTPLTVMLSFLQLMDDTQLSDEQDRYLARIHTAALKLQTLVDDVLELVSAETGVLKIAPKKTLLRKAFDGLDKDFADALKKQSQELVLKIDDGSAVMDSKIIRSVLTRIIDNAVKFGEPNSEIKVSAIPNGDKTVEISVENKGKSMSKDTINKILKPFSLDEDIMNHSKGTGLGLSVCQALLKAHASRLEIDCPKGKVRVSFHLPA